MQPCRDQNQKWHRGPRVAQLGWIFVKQLCCLHDLCSSYQIRLCHSCLCRNRITHWAISPMWLCIVSSTQGQMSQLFELINKTEELFVKILSYLDTVFGAWKFQDHPMGVLAVLFLKFARQSVLASKHHSYGFKFSSVVIMESSFARQHICLVGFAISW